MHQTFSQKKIHFFALGALPSNPQWPPAELPDSRTQLPLPLQISGYMPDTTVPVVSRRVFPKSAKKWEIFFGIFALKFCEFRRFFSRQKSTFLSLVKNHRQLWFTAPRSGMSHKARRKLAELRRRIFFFFFVWRSH